LGFKALQFRRGGVIPHPELASIGRVSTVLTASPARPSWLGWIRRRDLFAGFGYAVTVTFVLMIGWDMEDLLTAALKYGIGYSLFRHARFFLIMMVHQLPTVPLLTVAVNLAPPAGLKRYACLVGVGVLMWGYCTTFFYLEGEGGPNTEYAIMVALIITACVYRNSARSATSQLMQTQIEGAALDAEVKRARLQLLRAQIEPHFLFNTLATVRTLARIDRPAAVEMLDHLMRYLSEALPKLRQEESSLAEELQLVDAYLRIHQIRMGTRLSYELLVPDVLSGERIPTMMLLTLVENAVKHGINPAIEGGSIRVSASRESQALVLRVSDSGQGMAATDGHGMGLANIRRRLTMLYGDDAVLSLARAASRGVTATVSIPLATA
jgi:two-component sensor histidine kinase